MLKLSKTLSGDVVKRREGVCRAGVKFPSLSKLARTPETALKGIRRLVSKVVTDMIQNKESIFYPNVTKHFSGKFMVRVPPEVHREPVMQAAEAGVSLNRLASAKLSHSACPGAQNERAVMGTEPETSYFTVC